MATKTKMSGRAIAAHLLRNSRCKCGRDGQVTVRRETTSGSRWVHYCIHHMPRR